MSAAVATSTVQLAVLASLNVTLSPVTGMLTPPSQFPTAFQLLPAACIHVRAAPTNGMGSGSPSVQEVGKANAGGAGSRRSLAPLVLGRQPASLQRRFAHGCWLPRTVWTGCRTWYSREGVMLSAAPSLRTVRQMLGCSRPPMAHWRYVSSKPRCALMARAIETRTARLRASHRACDG